MKKIREIIFRISNSLYFLILKGVMKCVSLSFNIIRKQYEINKELQDKLCHEYLLNDKLRKLLRTSIETNDYTKLCDEVKVYG